MVATNSIVIAVLGAGLVGFAGVTTLVLGRIWMEAYLRVFAIPAGDLAISVPAYAFIAKDTIVLLFVASIIGGIFVARSVLPSDFGADSREADDKEPSLSQGDVTARRRRHDKIEERRRRTRFRRRRAKLAARLHPSSRSEPRTHEGVQGDELVTTAADPTAALLSRLRLARLRVALLGRARQLIGYVRIGLRGAGTRVSHVGRDFLGATLRSRPTRITAWAIDLLIWSVLPWLAPIAVLGFIALIVTTSDQRWARLFDTGFPIAGAFGGGALGILVVNIWRLHSERDWPSLPTTVAVIALLFAGFGPGLAWEWGEYHARIDIREEELLRAKLVFSEPNVPPEPIRPVGGGQTSSEVNVVLITPERVAITYPVGCVQRGVVGSSDEHVGALCEAMVLDRDAVGTIITLGRFGRPENDEVGSPTRVVLNTGKSDVFEAPIDLSGIRLDRVAYADSDATSATFAEAEAQSSDEAVLPLCTDARAPAEDPRGVWYEIVAHQGGSFAVELLPAGTRAYVNLARSGSCLALWELEPGVRLRLHPQDEFLMFVGTEHVLVEDRGDSKLLLSFVAGLMEPDAEPVLHASEEPIRLEGPIDVELRGDIGVQCALVSPTRTGEKDGLVCRPDDDGDASARGSLALGTWWLWPPGAGRMPFELLVFATTDGQGEQTEASGATLAGTE